MAKALETILLLAPGIDGSGVVEVILINVLVGKKPSQVKDCSSANPKP